MNKLTKKERFEEKVLSRYHVYNSVFATLPYDLISDTQQNNYEIQIRRD